MNRKMQIAVMTLCMALLLAWGGLSTVSAQVGINFTGTYNTSANLAPTDVAGAYPQANWNNTPGNTAPPGTLAAGEVKDATGAIVPGLEFSWDAEGNYGTGDSGTPDDVLFRGFIWNSPAKGTTHMIFTGIPYASYYVMVYVGNDGGGRTTQIQLNGAGTSYYVDNQNPGFLGKYVVATTTFLTNPAADIPASANVVVYPNVTGASLDIYRTAWRYNDGVVGVQIVPSNLIVLDTLTDDLPLISPAASATGVSPRSVPLVWYYRDVLFPGGQFKVYLKAGSAPGPGDVIATLPESNKTFLLPVLLPSTTYYWQVEVFQGANSKKSEVRSFITGTDPAMPTLPVTSGRILQLDATTGVQNASAAPAADGEAVATWVDQSPAGNSVNNTATPAARPTFKAVSDHGRPSLVFDGTRRLHGASTTAFAFGTANFDVFAIAKNPTYNAGNSIIVGNRNGSNNGFWMGWTGSNAYAAISGSDVFNSPPDRRGSWLIENLSRNTGTFEFFINNALLNATAVPPQDINTAEPITIGNRSFASSWFLRGEISEVLIYNRRLTDVEKTQVYQYLGTKYALSKPSVSMVWPAANSNISKDEDVVLRARVLAFIGSTVSNVEFFVNGVSVGSTTTPRGAVDYEFTWKPTTTGAKTVVAIVTDSAGLVNSATVTVNSVEMAPSIAFSTPSPAMSVGPTVDFPTTFTAVGDSFALTADKVTLAASEGSVTGTVSIVAGLLPRTPTIRVTGITGFGKLRVCIVAGAGTSPYGLGDTPAAVSPEAGVYPTLGTPPTAPTTGSKLWWDASNINGANNVGLTNGQLITSWVDRSGNGNDGTPTGNGATYTASVAGFNNKPAVTFHADKANELYNFATGMTDVRTIFWAIQRSDSGNGLHYILGCNTSWNGGYGWHAGDIGAADAGSASGEQIWHRDYAAGEIQNGVTRVNGVPVIGSRTSMYPLGYTIISLEAAGDCTADFFSGDGRNGYNDRSWMGNLAELIIYNRPLTAQERNNTGAYLAGKYAKITSFGYPDVPTVELVYPTVGAGVLPGEAVVLKATATPGSGASIAAVEFYADGVLAGTATSPNALGQYVVPWTAPATLGRVLIFARALDNRTPVASAGLSAQVYLSVVDPLFATVTGAGTHDGAGWATAMTLDEALTAARAALVTPPIYVKSGTYPRAASYTFGTAQALYGGFAGTETKASQRTGAPGVDNVTTLDGGTVATGIFRNGGRSIALDRLTFTGCAGTPVTLDGATADSTINNCTFSNNTSADPGGAIYVGDGKLNVTRSVFKDNTAGSWGGGAIAQWSNWGALHTILDGCWFENNQATGVGGAFCNYWGNVIATNCVFVNNSADAGGGAIESDGAPAWIFNNTFVGNVSAGSEFSCVYAGYGGGPGVYVVNNIFSTHAGQTVHTDGAPDVMPVLNNLFFNSPFDAANVTASGTVTGDPKFVSPTTDLRLQATSPAIDKGLTGAFLVDVNSYSIPTVDYAGLSRFDGKPDLGAYEIAVTGTITLTPDPLSFGIVVKETTSTKTLTLTNTGGNTPITVSAITPAGAGFALVAPPALPVTLVGGESLDIVVAFTAPVVTTRVPHAGTVTVVNTGAVTPAIGSLKAIAAPSLFPGTPPTVIVERSAGTPAATNVFPIEFNITFSEGVTGFELGDINWAAGDVKIGNVTGVTLIPREPTGALYTVRITAITGMGAGSWTVNPVVPAGVCETVGKYANLASTINEVVTYDTSLFGAVITTTALDITDAATVTCTVTFDAAVKGADALALIGSKLDLAGTSAGATITSVLEANASTAYTVEITTGGDGTLALTLNDDDAILKASTDAPLNGAGLSVIYGPMIEVDKTSPTLVSVQRAFGAARGTNETTVIFEVTFSDIVTGVDAGDFAISCSDPTADVVSVAAVGNTAFVVCNVNAAVGPYSLSVNTDATMTNRVGLGYVTGTPDPNEDYFILTQSPQTSVETWSWTLY